MSTTSPIKEKDRAASPATDGQSSAPPQPVSPAETIHAETASSSAKVEPTTPTPDASTRTVQEALQQSINRNNFEEEVGQVMGSLSSWWGGVKKQSASALTTLKADIDKTVSQAQADLEHLRTSNIEVVRKDSEEYAAEQEAEKAKKEAVKLAKEEEAKSKEKGKGKERATGGVEEEVSHEEGITANNILNKITSSTTLLQNSFQNTLQSTLNAAASNPNLSNLKNPELLTKKLAENLKISSAKENLQLSISQAEKLAEEYLKKSEGFLKDAENWIEENVKVLPLYEQQDNEGDDRHMVSMGWDGSDFYSFSTSTPTTSTTNQNNQDDLTIKKEKSKPISSLALASSRKDALLRRLREDKDLLMVDPQGENETNERKQEFNNWIQNHFESEKKELREQEEGNVGGIRMALVPELLTDEQFWQRYLFHKHMIEGEEQKRKALLQATTQESETDDFNWDDEPEESSPIAPTSTSTITTIPNTTTTTTTTADVTPKIENEGKLPPSASLPKSITSTSTSPRDSEESYDVVSDQGNVRKPVVATQPTAPVNEDDEDSDWE